MHDLSRNLGCLEERLDLQTVGWGGRGSGCDRWARSASGTGFPGAWFG